MLRGLQLGACEGARREQWWDGAWEPVVWLCSAAEFVR